MLAYYDLHERPPMSFAVCFQAIRAIVPYDNPYDVVLVDPRFRGAHDRHLQSPNWKRKQSSDLENISDFTKLFTCYG